MELIFHKGTILGKGEYTLPHGKWDDRTNSYMAQAFCYRDIIDYFENSEIEYKDNVLDLIPCPELSTNIELRDYQQKAVDNWLKQKKGVIIMPTGSGKTILGLKIVEEINCPTLIIVPTLDLIYQWKKKAEEFFSIKIGEYSGNKKILKPITLTTYDSAYINAEKLGNKFSLIIFDEVHHLPTESYSQIAELFAAPFRLGLTATYERSDGLHKKLPKLVGGKVYEVNPEELTDQYLSPYEVKKIYVSLTKEERQKYEHAYNKFKNYLISRNISLKSSQDFQKIIMRSGRDPAAREAILGRNEAERIAFDSRNKIKKLKELLDPQNKTIIFTKYNDIVYKISKYFFIPCITYRTSNQERKDILDKFKQGIYSVICSSQVLDEGIDVPDANIGIILSGTGSSREFIQRLGRLLRPKNGKKAILYELISDSTMEVKISNRRHL